MMQIRFTGRQFYPDHKASRAEVGRSIDNGDVLLISSQSAVALNDRATAHKSTFEMLHDKVQEAIRVVGRLPLALDEYIERDVALREVRAQLWQDFSNPDKLGNPDELARYTQNFLSRDVFQQLDA